MILPLRTNHFMDRAGQYGDLLFETMLFEDQNLKNADLHFTRLSQGLQILKMPLPYLAFDEFLDIANQAVRIGSTQNPLATRFRVRFTAKRQGLGNYLPSQPILTYEASASPFTPNSPQQLKVGVYLDQPKAPGIIANLKTGNALVYVMAQIFAAERNLHEALIINTEGRIIESATGNIFWKKNGTWYSPPLSEGCIEGIGRHIFMQNNPVIEKPCSLQDLQNADRCLITNALYPEREFILSI
jgi:branched-chain amino acid aminotransferase